MDSNILVIGSGFGGTIMACRLALQGRKLRLAERIAQNMTV
jgi:choline dehydrogenase-like flavoprotein